MLQSFLSDASDSILSWPLGDSAQPRGPMTIFGLVTPLPRRRVVLPRCRLLQTIFAIQSVRRCSRSCDHAILVSDERRVHVTNKLEQAQSSA